MKESAERNEKMSEKKMRRVFVIRKDLHLSPGKLAAMIAHCAEAYWTNAMKAGKIKDNEFDTLPAVETYGDSRKRLALYKDLTVFEMSKKAFEAGETSFQFKPMESRPTVTVQFEIPKDVWNDYVNGIFTKTICECRNKAQLKKAEDVIETLKVHGIKLVQGEDYGYINDRCLTELAPENPDGTTTIGMWFRPLPDDIAHRISKKFQLYRS